MLLHNKRPLIGITFSIVSVFLGLASGLLIKKVSIEANLTTTLFYRFVFSVPDLSRFDAAPLIAFTAPKETEYGTETDG